MKTITRKEAEKLNADPASRFVVAGYESELGIWGQGNSPEEALEDAQFNYESEDFDLAHVMEVVDK